jgi:hypothetical protein
MPQQIWEVGQEIITKIASTSSQLVRWTQMVLLLQMTCMPMEMQEIGMDVILMMI